jgi:hypothetical protein
MRFSERNGYKPIKTVIQHEYMDNDLRGRLWSLLYSYMEEYIENGYARLSNDINLPFLHFIRIIWDKYFKFPIDSIDLYVDDVVKRLRDIFFNSEWYLPYDFIELFMEYFPSLPYKEFSEKCNRILEEEASGYRLVNKIITPITNQEEITEIEYAINNKYTPVQEHISTALAFYSDRNNPDYRNSIKESISAVESLVKTATESENGTLGELIKRLKDKFSLHPALCDAFSKLYGYTNDADGIRHALLEIENIKNEDAKFFLVICSAFINYTQAKIDSHK